MTDLTCKKTSIHDVDETRLRYEMYHHKLKDMERINKLLYIDYVRTACNMVTRYSYLASILRLSWQEQSEKNKKNRTHYEAIKSWISEDFFNSEKIKILQISQCGYDAYGYSFQCKINNIIFEVVIPVTDNITVDNFDNAHQNKISVYAKQSGCFHLLIESYDIEDISNAIKKYCEEELQ